jgi:hypothetical protein
MTQNKFYLHPENNSLTWTYFTPDSEGGEYDYDGEYEDYEI